jgi:DNA repair exonuclease SbcCD ATPase subunit
MDSRQPKEVLSMESTDSGRQPLGYFDPTVEHMIPGPGMRPAPTAVGYDDPDVDAGSLWTDEEQDIEDEDEDQDEESPEETMRALQSVAQPEPEPEPEPEEAPVETQTEPAPMVATEPSTAKTVDDMMPGFLNDELRPILQAAEQAAAKIVERAEDESRQRSADLDALQARVTQQVTQLENWRQQVDPVIRSLQAKVNDIHQQIEKVPELIRQALDPVAAALSSLDPALSELVAVSGPVLRMQQIESDHGVGSPMSWGN